MSQADPDWLDDAARHVWRPYCQMQTALPPLPVMATQGSRLHLPDGRILLDGIASWWTACHGYNHPHIAEAVREQLASMPHVMLGGLVHEPAARLAARLATLLPDDLERVFFSESGSVAVEVAMKMAVQYHINKGGGRRRKIMAFRGGYHGDTFATMAVCDPGEGMHAHFAGVLAEQIIAPLPVDDESTAAFEALIDRSGDHVAAVLVEPLVQGAGGMLFHDAAVLARLRAAADAIGALLIFDEVFTGFGRTGTMFACEGAGVVPDIICLSKALTGGTMALAATVASRHVFEGFCSENPEHALMHGPTFMGNPLACAAANASLDLFEREPRLDQANAIANIARHALEPLRSSKGVRDVRVKGAIAVIELDRIASADHLAQRFIARGLWLRPFRNIVYLTPALTIAASDLVKMCEIVTDVVGSIEFGR